MEQEAWKVLVRQRLQEAAGRCARARVHVLLIKVLGNLGTPELVADLPAWNGWAQCTEGMLADASRDLTDAASLMASAGLIAILGAAASPAAPPRSDNDLPGDKEARRIRLGDLQDARARAERASRSVEASRTHLCAVGLLLDHPHLPGLDGLLNTKGASTRHDLKAAWKLEQESISLAEDALMWMWLL